MGCTGLGSDLVAEGSVVVTVAAAAKEPVSASVEGAFAEGAFTEGAFAEDSFTEGSSLRIVFNSRASPRNCFIGSEISSPFAFITLSGVIFDRSSFALLTDGLNFLRLSSDSGRFLDSRSRT